MTVSVVVPAFNAEQWIEETLSSVEQQAGDLEVIVVDDRSEDRTREIARRCLARSRFPGNVVTTHRNGGPSYARNVGWQSSHGEWVQFLDADDLIAPAKLSRQFTAAARTSDEIGVIYSPWQHLARVDGCWVPRGPVVRSKLDPDAVLSMVNDQKFGYVGPTLIRRTALDAVRGFAPMTLGEDLDLMLRIALAGYGFRSMESTDPLFFYRETPDSQWFRSAVDPAAVMQLDRTIRVAQLHLGARGTAVIPTETRRALAQRYTQHLDVVASHDGGDLKLVLGWIRELHLRSAQPGSHLLVRIMASVVGLATALQLKYRLRNLRRTISSEATKGHQNSAPR